jgi:hypothetical protein
MPLLRNAGMHLPFRESLTAVELNLGVSSLTSYLCGQVGVKQVRPFAKLREGSVPLKETEVPGWKTVDMPQEARNVFAAARRIGIRDDVLNAAALRLETFIPPVPSPAAPVE